jgi:HPt (histidine-containing phosphotransfer) domain-containing protein
MSHAANPRELGGTAIVEPSCEIEVLDCNVFRDLLESLAQPAAVAALYRKFIGNAAAFICELRVQEDAARIDTLHTLKGSAAMMGATRMAKIAMHLQTQLQCSSVQVAQAIQELEGELVRFRLAVAAQLLELGVSPGMLE